MWLGPLPERRGEQGVRGGEPPEERGHEVPLQYERDPAAGEDHRPAEDRAAPGGQAHIGPPLQRGPLPEGHEGERRVSHLLGLQPQETREKAA